MPSNTVPATVDKATREKVQSGAGMNVRRWERRDTGYGRVQGIENKVKQVLGGRENIALRK